MKSPFAFNITGLKEIDAKLAKLEKVDCKRIIRKAVRAGIKSVVKELKSNIPVDEGNYKRSLKVRASKLGNKGIGCRVWVDVDKLPNVQSKKPTNFYPAYLEYGWRDVAPNPIMRKTFFNQQEVVAKLMEDEVKRGIDGIA